MRWRRKRSHMERVERAAHSLSRWEWAGLMSIDSNRPSPYWNMYESALARELLGCECEDCKAA